MIAHVFGIPFEELVPSLAGASVALVAGRAWLSVRLRRRP